MSEKNGCIMFPVNNKYVYIVEMLCTVVFFELSNVLED